MVIRQKAVATLHWLQDPTNPEDAIIPEFLILMNSDYFAKVSDSKIFQGFQIKRLLYI